MTHRPSGPTSPLGVLTTLGQSVWLDYIHRRMLESGELKQLIEKRSVRGVTSNPTIFQQAIGQGDTYDAAVAQLASRGLGAEELYEALAIEDIRAACDLFRPIHEMSACNDGYVSLEVAPSLARDTAGTAREARRLWDAVGRPNLMIKIPGTQEGLPAVTESLAAGINVNITLLFAVSMYERVIDAYITGLERRLAAGKSVETLRSVASFFVSRVDTETDRRLEALVAAGRAKRDQVAPLLGRAAVANARLAYQKYVEHFEGDRFRAVMAKGAAVQRPLWASTSTKNPAYSPTKYVEELIGPDTVNTLPPQTLEEFARHGVAARTIDSGVDEARAQLDAIEKLGVSLSDVTDFLVTDGVKKFADSFDALLAAVEEKRGSMVDSR
jgi:transaldolase